MTIGDATSRLRGTLKAVKADPFLTDRELYSRILKYGAALMRREDSRNKVMAITSLFQKLPCKDLIAVDKVEACCGDIRSNITIMKSEYPLPAITEGSFGPMIRQVTSIDGSFRCYPTDPVTYVQIANSSNFKYNKNKYFWFLNGYIYLPNLSWDAVSVEAIFESDITQEECNGTCTLRQEQKLSIPEYLMAEIDQMVFKDYTGTMQIPSGQETDKVSTLR